MAKKTPLYDEHIKYNGKMVEFAGYELPIQYDTGLMTEHIAVRTKAGLFDVSHMGEIIVSGENAEAALNELLTNNIAGMYDGQVRYSVLPNELGGAVDDVLVYRISGQCFLLVVNAANLEKDAAWIKSRLPMDVEFKNISETVAQLAIQGPLSEIIMQKITDSDYIPKKYYSFVKEADISGAKCLISRTGYTGESGFEIYCANHDAAKIFEILMDAGKDSGLIPCGLGARDTLRLEAAMPLYGHELGEDIPLSEVGLDFAIKLSKPGFVGKEAIANHVPRYVRVGAKVADRGIAREHSDVYCGNEIVGTVTSGTHAPFLGYAITMLRIKREYADKELNADVRGKKLRLEIVPMPFYKKPN